MTKATRKSPAPSIQAGRRYCAVTSETSAYFAALCARSSRESSSVACSCIRTVRYAPSATKATASPTAMVVSRMTRLASDLR